jgi:hypothetical protein
MFTPAASRTPLHARNRLSGPVGCTGVRIIRIGIHARTTPPVVI